MMLKYKHIVKDRNIKVYYELNNKVNGEVVATKVYIHPKETFIKAYVRQLSSQETAVAKSNQDASTVEMIVNPRRYLVDMYVEFNNKTYQITSIDNLEFNGTEMKLRMKEVNQKNFDVTKWEDWK